MKRFATICICLSMVFTSIFAQDGTPKQTPQYNNPFEAMQQMMTQFQKMFGGGENTEKGDSTQNFGFRSFEMPFGEIDSTMSKAFGFSFDGNGFRSIFPESGDSTNANGFMQMQEQFKKMMPSMDFEKLFQGQTPFGGNDPSVVPPMDKKRREEEKKAKKKYQTEKL
ncbi:MAG: hypothetical protein U5L45_02645 [Saprospiraceae bacterium]|nr:hypothetical protein [Saprospiraceae bacterium]